MGDLVVAGSEPGRILLGRLAGGGGRGRNREPPLASPWCYGVLVLGPSRSGKTTSMLAPAVSSWEGPVVTTSIRFDVIERTWKVRSDKGPILVYNPKNEGSAGSNTWSPMIAVMGDDPWGGAKRMATSLVEAAGTAENRRNSHQEFWNSAAADYVAPLLLAAAPDAPSMEPVVRWLQLGDRAKREVKPRLANHQDALAAVEFVWGLEPRAADSVYLTARTALSAYQDPFVMRTCLSGRPGELPDITPETILGTESTPGATLYIISPPTDQRYFSPLFTALLTSVFDAAYARAGGRTLNPPLLLALDEVANITPIQDLPSLSSRAAGAGIQLVTVLHDLGQAEALWGVGETRTLLNNHYAKLLLGGLADVQTLEWAQKLLPETDQPRTGVSQVGRFGPVTASKSSEARPAMSLDELRTMPRGTALLLCGGHPAARVTLREWHVI